MKTYTPYQIVSWILAHLTDSSDIEKEKRLEEWLEESEEHYLLFEKWTDTANFHNYQVKYAEHNAQARFEEFCYLRRKEKRIYVLKRIGVVAAVLLPFLFVALFWFSSESRGPEPVLAAATTIRPGSSYAILTLPDGKTIQLDSSSRRTGLLVAGVSAIKDTLEYHEIPEQSGVCHTLFIPRGGEYVLKLSDGSKVWLNAETELKYPLTFDQAQRKVFLKGEAYFEVTKDEHCPFVIESGQHTVTVLGTSFGIRAYPEENQVLTTLENGIVRISTPEQEVWLQPGKQSRADLQTFRIEVKEVDTHLYTAWHSGKFVFIDQTLGDILNALSRWYNIDLIYTYPDLKEIQFTGELKRYGEINEFLEKIEHLEKVRFSIQGKTVTVSQY